MRIHILGVGNIGCIVAHAIKSLPKPPNVSLLLHKQVAIDQLKANGGIRLNNSDGSSVLQNGFDYELVNPISDKKLEYGIIDKLIVACKTTSILAALSSISHRLRRNSSVCIIHNGDGVMEKIECDLFDKGNDERMPTLIAGLTDHAGYQKSRYNVEYVSRGRLILGVYTDFNNMQSKINRVLDSDNQTDTSQMLYQSLATSQETKNTGELIKLLYDANLNTQICTLAKEQYERQLKLCFNSAINPLTALLMCRNGELVENDSYKIILHGVVKEFCHLMNHLYPEKENQFIKEEMIRLTENVASVTRMNKSSMRQDIEAGRVTEIDFINKVLCERAASHGLTLPLNQLLLELIKSKENLNTGI